MSGHVMTWTLESSYSEGQVAGKVACHEGPEARCRWESINDCGCESYYGMDVDEHGPYHIQEGGLPRPMDRSELEDWLEDKHRMAYGGPCNIAMFLNMEEPLEAYVGTTAVQVGTTPIEATWNGESYDWKVAE